MEFIVPDSTKPPHLRIFIMAKSSELSSSLILMPIDKDCVIYYALFPFLPGSGQYSYFINFFPLLSLISLILQVQIFLGLPFSLFFPQYELSSVGSLVLFIYVTCPNLSNCLYSIFISATSSLFFLQQSRLTGIRCRWEFYLLYTLSLTFLSISFFPNIVLFRAYFMFLNFPTRLTASCSIP